MKTEVAESPKPPMTKVQRLHYLRRTAAPEGKDICSRCGRVQTYGTMKAISEDSFDLLCTKCRRPRSSALRPTEYEIDLEARQWAEEYATHCENTQITRQEIFAAGARWARGVAQLGGPNPAIQTRRDETP